MMCACLMSVASMTADTGGILPIISIFSSKYSAAIYSNTAMDFLCCLHTCGLSTLLYLTVLPYFYRTQNDIPIYSAQS